MKVFTNIFIFLLLSSTAVFAQSANVRTLFDCTLQYDIVIDEKSDAELSKSMGGATKTVYIKGTQCRTDLVSPSYNQTIITNTKSDTTVVITERGSSKFISYLSEQKRSAQYKRFDGMTIKNTTETKPILGYECVKAIATLNDGTTLNIYYAPSIVPSNFDYEYQFKDVPGFVLEYESESSNGKFKNKYVATRITLSPVPASKFEIPTKGYRVI